MDFNYSREDETFRDEFRGWLEKNAEYAVPIRDGFGLEGGGGTTLDTLKRWHRKLHEDGWMAVGWPRAYGGRGAGVLQSIIYHEELARAHTMAPYIGSGITLLGPTLIQWGSEEQKRRFIPKILTAEEVWCQGYSEPNAGSDLASLQTRAAEDGDDFVVNGAKIWTSGAHYSNWIFLLVRTDSQAPKHKGISYLLVDMKSPGITVSPLVQMTGAHGFNQVFFEDVRVPKANLVGNKNQGWQVAMTTLMYERTGGHHRGLMRLVHELAELARRMPRNGANCWSDSAVRQRIVRFACEAQALKYTGFRQLTRELKGLPPGPEGSMLKLAGTELGLQIAMYAMELLGPYSQIGTGAEFAIDSGKWSQRMLAARGPTIYAGTNQIQHNVIGERVLGLPKG
ncbi:MAG TPA: acyl-CoA dehydrogenase family protein [Candidatus Binataceae bacterium]|nr:acyl-CoA dehydrogenase family protein [Candidatus Binataceae bacterium]